MNRKKDTVQEKLETWCTESKYILEFYSQKAALYDGWEHRLWKQTD